MDQRKSEGVVREGPALICVSDSFLQKISTLIGDIFMKGMCKKVIYHNEMIFF